MIYQLVFHQIPGGLCLKKQLIIMMALLATLLLFSFIIAADTNTTDLSICNIKCFNISNVRYAVTISPKMDYSTAVKCCGSLNSRLAVLNNVVNGINVMKIVVGMFPNTDFWVDAQRNATSGMFTWPDGSPVNASFWGGDKEPQDAENCARVHFDGTLWGIDCLIHYSAFCQLTSAQDIVTAINCSSECDDRTSSTTWSTPRTETLSQTNTAQASTSEGPTTVMSSDHAATSVSVPSTIQPALTTPSKPKLCPCTCRREVQLNDTTIEEKVKEIQEALSINKAALSSSVRKKRSSIDSRKSAQAIGLIGICIMVGCGAIIIASDVVKFFHVCK